MSGKQYVFGHNRGKFQSPSLPSKPTDRDAENSEQSVKSIILDQYDHLTHLKTHNDSVRNLSHSIERVSLEIINNVSILQSMKESKDKENIERVNVKLGQLNILSKKLKDEYNNILHTELSPLYEGWPEIYNMVLEGTDRVTLEHVLTVYEQYKSGHVTPAQAVSSGAQYMKQKYNLPDDFINPEALKDYIKDL
jgi:hypothetical protein